MTLTRDSLLLYLGIIGGILGVLAAQANLFPEKYRPWITVASAIVGVISAQLSASRLAGKDTDPARTETAFGGLVTLTKKE